MNFTIPASFTGSTDRQINISRQPSLMGNIRTHEVSAMGYPLQQSRADGINTTDHKTSFAINNIVAADVILIDSYFASLKSYISIVYPDETKKVYITNWSITRTSQPYGSISVEGRIVN